MLLLQTLFPTIFLFVSIKTCVVVAEKRKDKPCNHAESMNFLCQDNPSYFTTTYINEIKSWPWSCLLKPKSDKVRQTDCRSEI